MKRIVVLLAVIIASSICFAYTNVMGKHGNMMIEGRPFLSDAGLYNSYDLFGSPLGLFDLDSSRIAINAGYRYFGVGDARGHYLSGQAIRMGEPGKAFFEVFYGPDILSHKRAPVLNSQNLDMTTSSLTLQRFGLVLANRSGSGFFGASLLADGYIGNQKWNNDDNVRTLMGFERLRIDMGSQPHPSIRINLYAGVTARLDTLNSPPAAQRHEDRSFHMTLPEIGLNINFGGDDMPIQTNLSVEYASARFVYTSKNAGWNIPFSNVSVEKGDAPAIVNDSLKLFLMAQGRVPVSEALEEYVIKPGVILGFTSNNGKLRQPDGEDNYPIKLGDNLPDYGYDLTGFHFGAGTRFQASKYAGVHVEYIGSAMSLSVDSAYGRAAVASRMLHHTSFGVSTHLHDHLTLPLEITKRVAYFISGSAGIIPPRHSNIAPMNIIPGQSKAGLYQADTFLSGFQRTSGFTFGVDGQGLDGLLSTSFWMTFLSTKTASRKNSGLELGLSVGVSM